MEPFTKKVWKFRGDCKFDIFAAKSCQKKKTTKKYSEKRMGEFEVEEKKNT